MQKIKRLAVAGASLITSLSMLVAPAAAATSTVVVTEGNTQGWVFNGDPTTATPYNFTEDQSSIGDGSLFVPAISANESDKFIAALPLGSPTSDLTSVSYDFLIAGDGTADDSEQFYLNVYTILPESSETYYSCRFDYVPTTGSTTDFTTAVFNNTDTPIEVTPRNGATCPATLAELPEGSTVNFIAVNVGDTSDSDTGLAGYLDNVVVTSAGNSVAYDFELDEEEPEPVMPTSKDECKKGGWATFGVFKNQGDCVSYVATGGANLASF